MDCAVTVNNDTIKAQTEGNVIMALQAAYKGEITFKNGRAVEKNFDKHKMLRMNESTEINVLVMDNEEASGGVGEPGLPPLVQHFAMLFLMNRRIGLGNCLLIWERFSREILV